MTMTMTLPEAITALLLLSGAGIMLVASIGLLRLPDFYTRLHAAGKGDTLGQFLILAGLMIPAGLSLVSLKLGLIIIFILICNPTASHALARSAWRIGLKPTLERDPTYVTQFEGQLTTPEEREALMLPVAPVAECDDDDDGDEIESDEIEGDEIETDDPEDPENTVRAT